MPVGQKAKNREVDVDSLIDKGGSHPKEENAGDGNELHRFSVRFSNELVRLIDEHIDSLPVSTSRAQWLAQAAYEKLQREKNNS